MSENAIGSSQPASWKKKLTYLEGIRGFSAVMVMVSHYMLAFFPSMSNGHVTETHTKKGLELLYFKSPLLFLTNGQFYVSIFFILSGYVLSRAFFQTNDPNVLISASTRRFPRLYIPTAITLIFAYILVKIGANFNLQASAITGSIWLKALGGSPSALSFLKAILYGTMFRSDASYDTSLWTISIELYGSFLVFAALALIGTNKRRIAFYFLLFSVLMTEAKYYYAAFIFGILLNVTERFEIKNSAGRFVACLVLIITGLLLGGYPQIFNRSTPTIHGTFYNYFDSDFIISRSALTNTVGALFIVLVIQQSKILQTVLCNKFFTFLGKISFSLYLIHAIILQSLASFLFLKMHLYFDYLSSVAICAAVSITLTLVVSNMMTKYVDRKSVRMAHSIEKRFFSKN